MTKRTGVSQTRDWATEWLARPRFHALFAIGSPKQVASSVIRETMASAGIPMMATDLAERAAYHSMFTYRQSLDELDPQAVNGLDKARENADALAGEIVKILRTAREPAHV